MYEIEPGCRLFLSKRELALMSRVFSAGIIAGDQSVRASLRAKLSSALRALNEDTSEELHAEETGHDTDGVPTYAVRSAARGACGVAGDPCEGEPEAGRARVDEESARDRGVRGEVRQAGQ